MDSRWILYGRLAARAKCAHVMGESAPAAPGYREDLVTNAHHALRGVPLSPASRPSPPYDPRGTGGVVEAADTGPGIPPALQARLFVFFFGSWGRDRLRAATLPWALLRNTVGSISVRASPGRARCLGGLPVPGGGEHGQTMTTTETMHQDRPNHIDCG